MHRGAGVTRNGYWASGSEGWGRRQCLVAWETAVVHYALGRRVVWGPCRAMHVTSLMPCCLRAQCPIQRWACACIEGRPRYAIVLLGKHYLDVPAWPGAVLSNSRRSPELMER